MISEKVVQELTENTQIYKYVTRTSLLHPPRDHVVLRYGKGNFLGKISYFSIVDTDANLFLGL